MFPSILDAVEAMLCAFHLNCQDCDRNQSVLTVFPSTAHLYRITIYSTLKSLRRLRGHKYLLL